MAFLKPACSKALFHCKTAFLIVSRHSNGVEFSIHQVIGVTGSERASSGFFFFKCHLLIKSRYGVELEEVWSVTSLVK